MPAPLMPRRKYTEADIAVMCHMFDAGASDIDIAASLEKSVASIAQKRAELGLMRQTVVHAAPLHAQQYETMWKEAIRAGSAAFLADYARIYRRQVAA
jgi:hypothetical protein